jgi:transposase
MRSHRNARLTWRSRLLLVRRIKEMGWSVSSAARACGVSRTTAYRWLWRWQEHGEVGLHDRSSAPHRVWNRTAPKVVGRVERLRRKKMRATQIAEQMRMPVSTVGGILRRLGLSRARDIEERETVVRYERARPGELLHLDTKKLGRFTEPGKRVRCDGIQRSRGVGWENVHVCVDDHSRLAYVEILENEGADTCTAFLRSAVKWYEAQGVHVEGVMTDNGPGYLSRKFRAEKDDLGVRHLRTRPYRPQTNGKAERFIQTLLREWAYAGEYKRSAARSWALGPWIERYNHQRPHRGIGRVAPMSRIPAKV